MNTTETNEQKTETVITLHDCRIARRGKGAKGSVECQTLGKPEKVDEKTGVAGKFDYSGYASVALDKIVAFAIEKGHNPAVLLARGFDSIAKSASIRAQNAASLLQAKLVTEGLCNAKQAPTLAYQITNMLKISKAMGQESNLDMVIAGLKAAKAGDKKE